MTTGEATGSARDVTPTVVLALAGVLTLWASAFVGIRGTLHDFSPASLALLRFVIASVTLLVLWRATAPAQRRTATLPARRDVPLLLLAAFLVVVVYQLGLNFGERTVNPGTASFIVGQVPVFGTVFAVALLGERVSRRGWAGVAIGVLGTVMMLFADQSGLRVDVGALYVLLATVAESLYFVFSKPLLARYTALDLNVFVTVAGTAMLLPAAGGLAHDLSSASAGSVLVVGYLGMFPAALAYLGWSYCTTRLGVATLTSSLYALPLITIAVSAAFLGELPSALGMVAGIVSLAGAVLVNTRRADGTCTRTARRSPS